MYKLNLELTKKLYNDDKIRKLILPKDCYYNNFKVCNFSNLRKKFEDGEYKVALSYVDVGLKLWIRHCVIVTNKNEIIDLTFMTNKSKTHMKYDIVKIFNYEEYNKLIEESYDETGNYRCDLNGLKEEYDFYKNRKDKEVLYQINEYDFFEYIFPLIRKFEKISN